MGRYRRGPTNLRRNNGLDDCRWPPCAAPFPGACGAVRAAARPAIIAACSSAPKRSSTKSRPASTARTSSCTSTPDATTPGRPAGTCPRARCRRRKSKPAPCRTGALTWSLPSNAPYPVDDVALPGGIGRGGEVSHRVRDLLRLAEAPVRLPRDEGGTRLVVVGHGFRLGLEAPLERG